MAGQPQPGAHSRRLPVERQQAESQPELPRERVEPCCRMQSKMVKQAPRNRGVSPEQMERVLPARKVGKPALGLMTCSCILWSRVVRQEAEGTRLG